MGTTMRPDLKHLISGRPVGGRSQFLSVTVVNQTTLLLQFYLPAHSDRTSFCASRTKQILLTSNFLLTSTNLHSFKAFIFKNKETSSYVILRKIITGDMVHFKTLGYDLSENQSI